MRSPVLLSVMVAAALAMPATAHDFWLQPEQFALAAPGRVPAAVLVGHGDARQPSPMAVQKVVLLRSRGPAGDVDQRAALRGESLADGAALNLAAPGTHVVYMQTGPSRSDLPAIRFNSYLEEEGLTPAIRLRERTGRTEAPGRETYSRRVKALIQVGPPNARTQAHVTRPIGLTLEIVPETNPSVLPAGGTLPVRILYRGRPLAGALVKLTDLAADARPVATRRSDASGRAAFAIPRAGSWLLNVIWTEPVMGDPTRDFDTTFSSLTFGVGPPARPRT